MTQRETTLLKQNIKITMAGIITLISCTASFVWYGAQYTNRITNTVDNHTTDIVQIKKDVTDQRAQTADLYKSYTRHDVRIFTLEQKVK